MPCESIICSEFCLGKNPRIDEKIQKLIKCTVISTVVFFTGVFFFVLFFVFVF